MTKLIRYTTWDKKDETQKESADLLTPNLSWRSGSTKNYRKSSKHRDSKSKLSQKKKMKVEDKTKKIQNSLSRIKSNHFYQNLGAKIRTWASNANFRKQNTKK